MKTIYSILAILLISLSVNAQEVEYKVVSEYEFCNPDGGKMTTNIEESKNRKNAAAQIKSLNPGMTKRASKQIVKSLKKVYKNRPTYRMGEDMNLQFKCIRKDANNMRGNTTPYCKSININTKNQNSKKISIDDIYFVESGNVGANYECSRFSRMMGLTRFSSNIKDCDMITLGNIWIRKGEFGMQEIEVLNVTETYQFLADKIKKIQGNYLEYKKTL